MFFRIVGILWIFAGIWWVMRPQSLKRHFSKMVKKNRRKVLFLVAIFVSGLFFSAAKFAQGILANILLVVALLGIIKAVFILSSKASERMMDWWIDKPLWMWRVWAGGFVLIGLLFQTISR
ncbi:MAG: hypothetical protein QGI05_04540 [Candidatus Omnitrophota bacterium]|nr:hypothetical protein [Candidatus Omnitrophota bacterium]